MVLLQEPLWLQGLSADKLLQILSSRPKEYIVLTGAPPTEMGASTCCKGGKKTAYSQGAAVAVDWKPSLRAILHSDVLAADEADEEQKLDRVLDHLATPERQQRSSEDKANDNESEKSGEDEGSFAECKNMAAEEQKLDRGPAHLATPKRQQRARSPATGAWSVQKGPRRQQRPGWRWEVADRFRRQDPAWQEGKVAQGVPTRTPWSELADEDSDEESEQEEGNKEKCEKRSEDKASDTESEKSSEDDGELRRVREGTYTARVAQRRRGSPCRSNGIGGSRATEPYVR